MKWHSEMTLCIALTACTATADDNMFRSVTVGFEVTKPASWQFATAQQNLENLKNTKLKMRSFIK